MVGSRADQPQHGMGRPRRSISATRADFEARHPGRREKRTLAADYSVQSGMALDFGGGYRVWRALAAGVSVTRFKDSREDVPSERHRAAPFFYNRARAVTGVTSGARQEMAVHVDAMWVVPDQAEDDARGLRRPVVLQGEADGRQRLSTTTSRIRTTTGRWTRLITDDESSSVTGINFGADVGYYFTESIGVGGLIRFGRASVDTSIGPLDVGGPDSA